MTISLKQAKSLEHGTILYHVHNRNKDGTPQRWKVNGNVKIWKRDESRVQVPLKFGLYGYDYLTEHYLNDICLTEEEAKA